MTQRHKCAAGPLCLEDGHEQYITDLATPETAHGQRTRSNGTPTFGKRLAAGFLHGSFCVAKAFAVCFYTCYVFCPPIPSCAARKIAFHPPSNQFYHFVIRAENGEETSATLKQCIGKSIIRVVLEIPNNQMHQQGIKLVEDVYPFVVTTSKKSLVAGVYVPCRLWDRPLALQRKVIIFSQPNSSNLSTFLWGIHGFGFREMSDKLGVDFYAFDYSGFGISTGTASEENVYEDIRAIYEYVKMNRPDCKIYLMGCSLGTSACIDLASKVQDENLGGVVLLAPFTSGLGVMCGVQNKSYKFDAFKSIDKAPLIDVPVLLAHGLRDTIIPYEHSIVLAKSLKKSEPVELVRNADHMSILDTHSTTVFQRILDFLLSDS